MHTNLDVSFVILQLSFIQLQTYFIPSAGPAKILSDYSNSVWQLGKLILGGLFDWKVVEARL